MPLLANRANSTDMSERRGKLLSSEMHWLVRYVDVTFPTLPESVMVREAFLGRLGWTY